MEHIGACMHLPINYPRERAKNNRSHWRNKANRSQALMALDDKYQFACTRETETSVQRMRRSASDDRGSWKVRQLAGLLDAADFRSEFITE